LIPGRQFRLQGIRIGIARSLSDGKVPIKGTGLNRLRPDLVDSIDAAHKVIQRSKVGTDQCLAGLPEPVRDAVLEMAVTDENNDRGQSHLHLFLYPPVVIHDGQEIVL
jgi:hypothetical protein